METVAGPISEESSGAGGQAMEPGQVQVAKRDRLEPLKRDIPALIGMPPSSAQLSLQCLECHITFSDFKGKERHLKKRHPAEYEAAVLGDSLFTCYVCDRAFASSREMLEHQRGHTEKRPFKCPVCGEGFPRSTELTLHKRAHSRQTGYTCADCGKPCKTLTLLRYHRRTHTGERPYACPHPHCARRFSQSSGLYRHQLTHEEGGPQEDEDVHSCPLCHVTFKNGKTLLRHMKHKHAVDQQGAPEEQLVKQLESIRQPQQLDLTPQLVQLLKQSGPPQSALPPQPQAQLEPRPPVPLEPQPPAQLEPQTQAQLEPQPHLQLQLELQPQLELQSEPQLELQSLPLVLELQTQKEPQLAPQTPLQQQLEPQPLEPPLQQQLEPQPLEPPLQQQPEPQPLEPPLQQQPEPQPLEPPLQQQLEPQPLEPQLQLQPEPQPLEPPLQQQLEPQPLEPPLQLQPEPQPLEPPLQQQLEPQPLEPPLQLQPEPQPLEPPLQQQLEPQPLEPQLQLPQPLETPLQLPQSLEPPQQQQLEPQPLEPPLLQQLEPEQQLQLPELRPQLELQQQPQVELQVQPPAPLPLLLTSAALQSPPAQSRQPDQPPDRALEPSPPAPPRPARGRHSRKKPPQPAAKQGLPKRKSQAEPPGQQRKRQKRRPAEQAAPCCPPSPSASRGNPRKRKAPAPAAPPAGGPGGVCAERFCREPGLRDPWERGHGRGAARGEPDTGSEGEMELPRVSETPTRLEGDPEAGPDAGGSAEPGGVAGPAGGAAPTSPWSREPEGAGPPAGGGTAKPAERRSADLDTETAAGPFPVQDRALDLSGLRGREGRNARPAEREGALRLAAAEPPDSAGSPCLDRREQPEEEQREAGQNGGDSPGAEGGGGEEQREGTGGTPPDGPLPFPSASPPLPPPASSPAALPTAGSGRPSPEQGDRHQSCSRPPGPDPPAPGPRPPPGPSEGEESAPEPRDDRAIPPSDPRRRLRSSSRAPAAAPTPASPGAARGQRGKRGGRRSAAAARAAPGPASRSQSRPADPGEIKQEEEEAEVAIGGGGGEGGGRMGRPGQTAPQEEEEGIRDRHGGGEEQEEGEARSGQGPGGVGQLLFHLGSRVAPEGALLKEEEGMELVEVFRASPVATGGGLSLAIHQGALAAAALMGASLGESSEDQEQIVFELGSVTTSVEVVKVEEGEEEEGGRRSQASVLLEGFFPPPPPGSEGEEEEERASAGRQSGRQVASLLDFGVQVGPADGEVSLIEALGGRVIKVEEVPPSELQPGGDTPPGSQQQEESPEEEGGAEGVRVFLVKEEDPLILDEEPACQEHPGHPRDTGAAEAGRAVPEEGPRGSQAGDGAGRSERGRGGGVKEEEREVELRPPLPPLQRADGPVGVLQQEEQAAPDPGEEMEETGPAVTDPGEEMEETGPAAPEPDAGAPSAHRAHWLMSVSSSSSGSLVTEGGEREQRRPEPVDTEPDGNVSSTGVLQQDSGQHCRHQELLTRLDQSSDLDDSDGSDSEPDGEAAALGRYRGDSARDGPATPVGVLRLQEWTRGRFPAHPESVFSEPPPRPGGASLSPLEYFSRYLDWHTWEGVARYTNSRPHPAGATPPIRTSAGEIARLVGVHIAMATLRFPCARLYWQESTRVPLVAGAMPADRFAALQRALRLAEGRPGAGEGDGLWRVRPLLDRVRRGCLALPREGHCAVMTRPVPLGRRRGTPGLRNTVLVGSSGLVLDFLVRPDRPSDGDDEEEEEEEAEAVARVTNTISAPEPGKRSVVFLRDERCATPGVLQRLLVAGLRGAGRAGAAALQPGGSWEELVRADGGMCLVRCRQGQFLSTYVGGAAPGSRHADSGVPAVAREFQTFTRGAELCADLLALYRCAASGPARSRWTLALLWHLVDLALANSWLQYRRDLQGGAGAAGPPAGTLMAFRLQVSQALISAGGSGVPPAPRPPSRAPSPPPPPPPAQRETAPGPAPPAAAARYDGRGHWPEQPGASLAGPCALEGCRRDSSVRCLKCCVFLCIARADNCFLKFHSQ
ncbi:zinc finger protein 576, tandem duplicate 1 isoform X2 [Lepisosteus oculatus]|uniref:zinc finger protein 576, tandem duplicate 1 isoform X2 n=1 Tax=Lepisosteus oculatus TaxID=7918 RepID=UPI0037207558